MIENCSLVFFKSAKALVSCVNKFAKSKTFCAILRRSDFIASISSKICFILFFVSLSILFLSFENLFINSLNFKFNALIVAECVSKLFLKCDVCSLNNFLVSLTVFCNFSN